MAVNVFPAASSGDIWTLLTSATPTSGAAVNFGSISGYRKLRVQWADIATGSSAQVAVRINNVSTTSYHLTYFAEALTGPVKTSSSRVALSNANSTTRHVGFMEFPTANQSIVQTFGSGFGYNDGASPTRKEIEVLTTISGAITEINVITTSGDFAAGNTGTIYLYGVAA